MKNYSYHDVQPGRILALSTLSQAMVAALGTKRKLFGDADCTQKARGLGF